MRAWLSPLPALVVGSVLFAGVASAQSTPEPVVCPARCQPVHVMTHAERVRHDAARQARLEARRAHEAEFEQLRHEHDALAATRAELARERDARLQTERELATARSEDEAAEARLNEAQRARFAAEQRAAVVTRGHMARGGGPAR